MLDTARAELRTPQGTLALREAEAALLHALALAPGGVLESWQALEKLDKPVDEQGKAQLAQADAELEKARKESIQRQAAEQVAALKAQEQAKKDKAQNQKQLDKEAAQLKKADAKAAKEKAAADAKAAKQQAEAAAKAAKAQEPAAQAEPSAKAEPAAQTEPQVTTTTSEVTK